MTSVSWGIPGKHSRQRWRTKLRAFLKDINYTNLLHSITGVTKEADNSIEKITCQDILFNVIFGCERELWRVRFGVN